MGEYCTEKRVFAVIQLCNLPRRLDLFIYDLCCERAKHNKFTDAQSKTCPIEWSIPVMLTVLLIFLRINDCIPLAIHSEQASTMKRRNLFSIPPVHDSCSSSLQVPYALSSLQRVCGWPSPHNFKPNRHIFHMSNVVKFGILTTKAAELLFCKKTGTIDGRTGCSPAAGVAQRVSPLLSCYYFMQVRSFDTGYAQECVLTWLCWFSGPSIMRSC